MLARGLAGAALLWAAVVWQPAAAASGDGYRVAGIMAVGSDYLAVLALPDGHQSLVRTGSTVAGARVLALTDHSVRLAFPDREVTLLLDQAPRTAPAAAVAVASVKPASAPAATTPNASPKSRPLPVGQAASGASYAHMQSVSPRDVRRLAAAGPQGADADPGRAAAVSLASVANLPPNSRVTQVNDMPVSGADAALAQVAARLESGYPAWLNVQTAAGMQRVYLAPASR